MNIFSAIWKYFGLFQTHTIRLFHITILLLVITQIIISNWMSISNTGVIPSSGYQSYFTWLHISIGSLLLFLSLIFIFICLKTRGFQYFFPYLWGNMSQCIEDCKLLWKFKLPDAKPYGLACIIQGLGLGAILLVVFSGSTWFTLWLMNNSYANEARNIHKMLTGLIELYIFGHGTLGVIHFIIWDKNIPKKL